MRGAVCIAVLLALAACVSPQSTTRADASKEQLAVDLIDAHQLERAYAASTSIKVVTSEQPYIAKLTRETSADALKPFISVTVAVFYDLWATPLKSDAAKALAAELSREDLLTLLDPRAVEEVRGKPRPAFLEMRYSNDRLTKAMGAYVLAEVSAVRRMAEIVGPQVKERISADPSILKRGA